MASVSSATLTRKNSPVRDAYKGSSGHHCAVVGCRNNQRKRSRLLRAFCGEHDTRRESCRCGIFSLHRFPAASRNPELRLQWITAVNRKDYEPSEHARVCSEHFLDRKPSEQNPVPVLRLGYSKKDHKVQSEQTCQAICPWPIVCDKGADQVPNSALEICIEDDEIALRTQSPPPSALARGAGQVPNSTLEICIEDDEIASRTPSPPPAALAIGAYPAGVCIHHSHGGRRCNHRRPRVRARRLKKQSCAVIGCSNTQSKRRRLMAGLCREHKVPRRKCKCGVFNFHHPPPLWEHHHDWKVALSLPDDQINTNMWVCSVHFVDGKPTSANPIPTLRIGHINQGVQTAQLVRNSSDSWTWKKNVSTQRSGPTMCTAMCQAGEQTAEFFRDNATQWERPYEEVHAEHSYADMKWLLEYTSLKWLLRGEQADSE